MSQLAVCADLIPLTLEMSVSAGAGDAMSAEASASTAFFMADA